MASPTYEECFMGKEKKRKPDRYVTCTKVYKIKMIISNMQRFVQEKFKISEFKT